MGWQEAGVAWGFRSVDWAYLMEPLFGSVYDALASSLDLGHDATLLDVGCGAGLALQRYGPHCARVAGIDAAEGLLAIARRRVPAADLRHGSMTELPWSDGTFTRVTGVNSFAYADDGALAEAFRVLQRGGLLGIGFWKDPMDYLWALGTLGAALAPHVGVEDAHVPLRMADPDAARDILSGIGFEVVRSGAVVGVSEFADVDVAYRALSSTGMIYPLTQNGEEAALRAATVATLGTLASADTGVRMAAQFGWIVARRR